MAFQEFDGLSYLKIDIASNFGLDKANWSDRIAWFDENEAQLENLVKQADEPALFYAATKAYRDTQNGVPTGYMISLDATSSGLQLLACLTGDTPAAKLCNVVSTGKRECAYKNIYKLMTDALGEQMTASHDDTKQAIMTSLYGSTAMPRNVFGEGPLLDMFYTTMKKYAPAAWELNQAFLAIWDKNALQYEWVLPDNFHVKSKVMDNVKETITFKGQQEEVFFKENIPTETGRSLGANVVHSVDGFIVRELGRRCNYDPKVFNKVLDAIENPKNRPMLEDMDNVKMVLTLWDRYKASGFLSARILDYLDNETINLVNTDVILELLGSMPEKPFPVVAIHDCFRVHPNYGNDIREQYNRQLMLIAKSNMLSDIFTQLLGKPITIGKYDERMFENVINAEYALS